MRWTVLVPVRALPWAKTRLAVDLPAPLHVAVVEAIRADTLAAVHAAEAVEQLLLIGDVAGPDIDLVQTSPGLNGALRDGAAVAAQRWPANGVVALMADLPSLAADELTAALTTAAAHRHAFVADAADTGTTLLAAVPGAALQPAFGLGSAARHELFATRLDAGAGLRHDVDTADDLAAAARVGLGAHTSAVLGTDWMVPRSS